MKKKIIIIIKLARFGIPARKKSVLSMKTLFYVKREREREKKMLLGTCYTKQLFK